MLHGLTDSWHSFSRVLPELPPRYRVLVPDQRGHGDSERPTSGYAPEDFAAEVLALMDEVGLERAALVGHSMGSFVAQAAAFQQEVEALTDPVPPEFLREAVAASLRVPARVWRAALAGVLSDPRVARLGRIRMPTLLLYGERDAVWPRAQQDSLLALLPQATLRIYAGVGHAPHWERPAEFARDLDTFLSGS